MSKLGIIVDGQGDFAALKARFESKFRILKTDGPRGHTVSIEKIISGSRKQIEILRLLNYTEIIVLLDFENRDTTYKTFFDELTLQFSRVELGISIYVAIPNMMIENWYLADIEHLSKKKNFIKDGLRQKNYEGKHGKSELKKMFIKGTNYNEVLHGAQMFKIVRFSVAKTNSQSFMTFYETIKRYL